jgi:hypothetical protein
MARIYTPAQLKHTFNRFELANGILRCGGLTHPYRELFMQISAKNNYTRKSYRLSECPQMARVVFTHKPSKHITGDDQIVIYLRTPVVMSYSTGSWESFKIKHSGADVVAWGEMLFDK